MGEGSDWQMRFDESGVFRASLSGDRGDGSVAEDRHDDTISVAVAKALFDQIARIVEQHPQGLPAAPHHGGLRGNVLTLTGFAAVPVRYGEGQPPFTQIFDALRATKSKQGQIAAFINRL